MMIHSGAVMYVLQLAVHQSRSIQPGGLEHRKPSDIDTSTRFIDAECSQLCKSKFVTLTIEK